MKSWVLGSRSDCDIVVDSPLVSGRHCRLTQGPGGLFLEDLGSTNGTHVNGSPIASAAVARTDSIMLSRTVPLPWPSEVFKTLRIGRLAENDVVLDDPRVSGFHARLMIGEGAPAMIEDLGSSNGTFVNSVDRRITSPTPVQGTDRLFFGSFAIPAARILGASRASLGALPDRTLVFQKLESEPAPVPPNGLVRWRPILPATSLLIALAVVPYVGRVPTQPLTNERWIQTAQGAAAATFALALASLWLGCSLGMAGFGPPETRAIGSARALSRLGRRLAALLAACVFGSAFLLAILSWVAGLKGSAVALWVVAATTSAVGLLLGLVVSEFFVQWRTVLAVLLCLMTAEVFLGGRLTPLAEMSTPLRWVSAILPARWSFEALLLLESARHPRWMIDARAGSAAESDFAEVFFPAYKERMGPRADLTALAAMLIGEAGCLFFILDRRKRLLKPLA